MKEVLATARNIIGYPREGGGFDPAAELIVVVTEPTFKVDAGGTFIRERQTETLRMVVTKSGLDRMIETLTEIRDDMAEVEGNDEAH